MAPALLEHNLFGWGGQVQGPSTVRNQGPQRGGLAGGNGEQPIVMGGQERREAGQVDLPGLIEGQVLGQPPEQRGTMTSRSVSWVRDANRNPVKVASWAQTPCLPVRAVTAVAGSSSRRST